MMSVLLVLLSLTSCASGNIIRSADSLLNPPLYYDEYEDLVKAFRDYAGYEVSLCSPYSGNHRSAIIVENIDGDPSYEAVVLYKTAPSPETGTSEVRIGYFDYFNDEWQTVGDMAGHGDGIESISLTDMDGDGIREIIVVWNTSGIISNFFLSIYRATISDPEFYEIFNENCMSYIVFDIDDDSYDDLFYITQGSNPDIPQKTARVIGISGDSLVLHGEAKLDPNVSRYTLTVPEKRSDEGTFSLYIDALKGDQNMITEYLYWDSEDSVLVNPFFNPETMSNTKTFRYEQISSEDINSDGKLDIPSQSVFSEQVGSFNGVDLISADSSETVYLTVWQNFSKGETVDVAYTLVNVADGYMIHLSEEELDTVSVSSNSSENCWIVYNTDPATGEAVELYSVHKIPNGGTDTAVNENYIPIIESNNETVYVYISPSGAQSGIDEKYIKEIITKFP